MSTTSVVKGVAVPENPERRAVLTDAGLAVLAREGTRGLTHRAVDHEAGVPQGTAANYFRSRAALLGAVGERVLERLAPDPDRLAALEAQPVDTALFTAYMRDIVARTTAEPTLVLALYELRLEARRRPELAGTLGATLRRAFRFDVEYAAAVGFPTEALDIALVRYAMDGFLLDLLTPSIGLGVDPEVVLATLVERLMGRVGGDAPGAA